MTAINLKATISEQLNASSSASVKQVYNFAWQHLKAATTFRGHAAALENSNDGLEFDAFFEGIRSYVSGTIMSATACLEAHINELFISPHCRLKPMLKDFEVDFWGDKGIERKKILEKYKLALEMIGATALDQNSQIRRDAWALIEYRNALVHYKPTWDPDRNRKIELVNVLSGRYRLSPFLDSRADFVTMQSMSAGCADWAVRTVFGFLHEFDSRSNLDPSKMVGFWNLESQSLVVPI